jgi:hypothetical protein
MSEPRKDPWLRLLDLRDASPKPEAKRKRGRPRAAFPRVDVRARVTPSDATALKEIVELLRKRFKRPVHRGDVVAFMTFLLRSRLQGAGKRLELPEEVDSFVALAEYLEEH